ncbi:MAG: hypothetical protein ACC628_18310 [Pirellulaceae bacterium]
MTAQARNIRVTFQKTGPIVVRDKIEVLATEMADPSHPVGDAWIEEDMTFVAVYIAFPYFPEEEIKPQLNENGFDWGHQAQDVYRQQHPGENIVFQDKKN